MKSQKYERYHHIVQTINKCGMKRLKHYCLSKKRPVGNFDRDIAIIRLVLKGETGKAITEYNISRQFANILLDRYYEYALQAMEGEHT